MDGFFDWKGWGWAGWGALGVIVSVLVAIWPKKGGEASSGSAPSAGFGLRDYQEGLERREAGLREDLERAHGAERDLLRHQREEVARKLADVEGAYQAMLAELNEARAALGGLSGGGSRDGAAEAGPQAMARARAAITPALEAAHRRGALDAEGRPLWSDPGVRADFDAAYGREPENEDYLYGAALIADALDDASGAEPLYRRALARVEGRQAEAWPNFFSAGDALAGLLRARGASDEAEALYRRLIAARERASGPEDPGLAHDLNSLAVLLHGRGDAAEAEALYRRAIALEEKEAGPESVGLEQLLENLAGLLHEKGALAEAEALYRRCAAITAKEDFARSYSHASNLQALADLLAEKGEHAEAESLLRQTLDIVSEVFGPESAEVRPPLESLAGVLEARGVSGEALRRRAAALPEA
ncbi:tetratricopeptide repeat protein [Neomegalonema sp.]|uniref:tetratricopeptide repeat protein n=1 Tax=Neomegalonema sp. TaxID=2039713 RepID=UPI0026270AFF|nr:tetratricopeptide repeat protein [Neomegalonema sp.]MDD2868788.1 tetratricopeptide repeat protein [Neomegalonema sp.]